MSMIPQYLSVHPRSPVFRMGFTHNVENAAVLLSSKVLLQYKGSSSWSIGSFRRNIGIASRPEALEFFTFDSNFCNWWIVKGLVLNGNRSKFSLLKNASFSNLDAFDPGVPRRFLKWWNHFSSLSSLFTPINWVKDTAFCWWLLIVFHEFICYFCSCSFGKN